MSLRPHAGIAEKILWGGLIVFSGGAAMLIFIIALFAPVALLFCDDPSQTPGDCARTAATIVEFSVFFGIWPLLGLFELAWSGKRWLERYGKLYPFLLTVVALAAFVWAAVHSFRGDSSQFAAMVVLPYLATGLWGMLYLAVRSRAERRIRQQAEVKATVP